MASADIAPTSARRDWVFANPWPWLAAGLLLCGWSWAWARAFGPSAADTRLVPLALGLLAAGVALVLRLSSSRPAYLEGLPRGTRQLALLLLGLLFGLTALAMTAVVVLAGFGDERLPWRLGTAVVTWLVLAPVSAAAARQCLRHSRGQDSLAPADEAAALLLAAGLCCFVGAWALYLGPDAAEDWDTIRLFLAVLAVVALAAAPLAVVGPRARRLVVSLLILLHFGGIMTASLAAPPAPWLVTQVWIRVYRPYLEFMYLNNAYHFYAPEPGPASYLWCRLIYVDTQAEEPGAEVGVWYKVPRLDAAGQPLHSTALEYQRYLALTEGTVPSDPAPPVVVINKDGQPEQAKYYAERAAAVPGYSVVVGQKRPPLAVPFDPNLPHLQQYSPPNQATKMLIASYARHACLRPHPDDAADAAPPRYRVKAVKLYRAIHHIGLPLYYSDPTYDPRHPLMYRPYFLGTYDPEGRLLEPHDPFLYWLLPVIQRAVPADPGDPWSRPRVYIDSYARKHAGDAEWSREDRKETLWPEP